MRRFSTVLSKHPPVICGRGWQLSPSVDAVQVTWMSPCSFLARFSCSIRSLIFIFGKGRTSRGWQRLERRLGIRAAIWPCHHRGVLDTRYLRPCSPFIGISYLVLMLVFWQSVLRHIDQHWPIAVRHYEDSRGPCTPVFPAWISPRYPAKARRSRTSGCRQPRGAACWSLRVSFFGHSL